MREDGSTENFGDVVSKYALRFKLCYAIRSKGGQIDEKDVGRW
jgi:hypothetical protein